MLGWQRQYTVKPTILYIDRHCAVMMSQRWPRYKSRALCSLRALPFRIEHAPSRRWCVFSPVFIVRFHSICYKKHTPVTGAPAHILLGFWLSEFRMWMRVSSAACHLLLPINQCIFYMLTPGWLQPVPRAWGFIVKRLFWSCVKPCTYLFCATCVPTCSHHSIASRMCCNFVAMFV